MIGGKQKIIVAALIIIAVVIALYVVDSIMPDPESEDRLTPFLIEDYASHTLAVALVKYRKFEGRSPASLEALVEKGYYDFGIDRSPADYEFYPGATHDLPGDLAVFWTKKSYPLEMPDGPRGEYYFVYTVSEDVFRFERKQFREVVYRPQMAARAMLTKSTTQAADRLVLMLRARDWVLDSLEIQCACYRLGKLGAGSGALMRALAFDVPEAELRDLKKKIPNKALYAAQVNLRREHAKKVRFESARALARLGDRSGKTALLEGMKSGNYSTRVKACESVKSLGFDLSGYNPLLDEAARKAAVAKIK